MMLLTAWALYWLLAWLAHLKIAVVATKLFLYYLNSVCCHCLISAVDLMLLPLWMAESVLQWMISWLTGGSEIMWKRLEIGMEIEMEMEPEMEMKAEESWEELILGWL